MVKRNDDEASRSRDITAEAPNSAVTGRSIEAVRGDAGGAAVAAGARPPGIRRCWPSRSGCPRTCGTLERPGWLYERKLDGLRCMAVRNGDQVELWSRNHQPFTDSLSGDRRRPGRPAGRQLHHRRRIGGVRRQADQLRPAAATAARRPGPSCTSSTCCTCSAGTRPACRSRTATGCWPRPWTGSATSVHLVEAVEGRPESPARRGLPRRVGRAHRQTGREHLPGGRSPDWRKLKCTASQDLVVGGLDGSVRTAGWSRRPAGRVLRRRGRAALRRAGRYRVRRQGARRCCTGPLADWHATSRRSSTPARSRAAHWVRPEMVVAVAFTEWTPDGRLRHPRFEGVRTGGEPARTSAASSLEKLPSTTYAAGQSTVLGRDPGRVALGAHQRRFALSAGGPGAERHRASAGRPAPPSPGGAARGATQDASASTTWPPCWATSTVTAPTSRADLTRLLGLNRSTIAALGRGPLRPGTGGERTQAGRGTAGPALQSGDGSH